ncbi:maternal protein exuperantia-2-like [Daphnia pulicaria]|uniref:maternal protein exuperantia-2-like n=1 Tax=Daphnia pulicaria TaxID=35523 RepID=UPI001EEC1770|nr:maternal protein exuperantia-2-like [Daphnia pulicaria]
MTNNSEEQQTSSSTKETIIEVVIQPPTPEAKVESDAPPAVITTQPAQPMPEHDDSIAVVMWEATVTGRRLIDEMEEKAEGHDFNEYVMPYGKLPLNVIRNYNLRIVDTGRYRMLKEIRNSRMLKSKREVAACNDFASWLIKLQKDNFTDRKIVLVFFEPRHSKILQLFQALERYRLLDDVNKILLGCVNGWDLLRQ